MVYGLLDLYRRSRGSSQRPTVFFRIDSAMRHEMMGGVAVSMSVIGASMCWLGCQMTPLGIYLGDGRGLLFELLSPVLCLLASVIVVHRCAGATHGDLTALANSSETLAAIGLLLQMGCGYLYNVRTLYARSGAPVLDADQHSSGVASALTLSRGLHSLNTWQAPLQTETAHHAAMLYAGGTVACTVSMLATLYLVFMWRRSRSKLQVKHIWLPRCSKQAVATLLLTACGALHTVRHVELPGAEKGLLHSRVPVIYKVEAIQPGDVLTLDLESHDQGLPTPNLTLTSTLLLKLHLTPGPLRQQTPYIRSVYRPNVRATVLPPAGLRIARYIRLIQRLILLLSQILPQTMTVRVRVRGRP